ncbi:hypothetical protein [Methanocella conradii]|uniref:hypothetical protein n=1 Tax=Methanocella conradii TaxID=1175444 RepID=UPI00157D87CD|nr:hypothetical protein [Methanocella conradii]
MSLIKQKNNKEFDIKRVGITYLIKLENEAPLNENMIEETGNIHKRITLYNGIEKAKRSGNSIKAQHRRAIADLIGKDETQCNSTENPCGECLACALHGFAMVHGNNSMHSSMVSFSDAVSVETADDCITGLTETMLKSPIQSADVSPQPFSYERVKAGTHLVGTAYLTLTGRKTDWEFVFEDEKQIIDAFWYGLRSVLTNQTYQQTVMTARHDARFTPELLIVSEVRKLPADIMVSPDLTITDAQKAKDDLKAKANMLKSLLKQGDGNVIDIIEGSEILKYLSNKGHVTNKNVKSTCKVKNKKKESSEKSKEEAEAVGESGE